MPAPSPPVPQVSSSGKPDRSRFPSGSSVRGPRRRPPQARRRSHPSTCRAVRNAAHGVSDASPSSSAVNAERLSDDGQAVAGAERLEGRGQGVHHGTRTVCRSITPLTQPVETDDRLDVIGPLVQDLDGLFGRLDRPGYRSPRSRRPAARARASGLSASTFRTRAPAPAFGKLESLGELGIQGGELEPQREARRGVRAVGTADQPRGIDRRLGGRRGEHVAEMSVRVRPR